MDPFTIATGAASLAATATSISVWLYNLINDMKNVDTKIFALSKEVTLLTTLLTSVEKTVRQCQSQALTLAHLDEHMWQQIDNALMDCKITVEGLDRLVMRINSEYDPEAKKLVKLLKKPSMHFRFTVHSDEISDFTSKIYKSNCAMQTALAVINVSLTFRTNASQENLFQELQNLKGLVEQAINASHTADLGSDPFSARQTRNLETLAKAAQKFHSAASSTASTRYVGGDRRSYWVGSEAGSLTDAERERIERWNDLSTVEESLEDSTTEATLPTDNSTTITIPDMEESVKDTGNGKGKGKEADNGEDSSDDDDESDVELDFMRNFEDLAYASVLAADYSKAEQCLRMAIERSTGDTSGSTDFKLFKTQLALCCCLQEKWEHAAGILTSLSKTKAAANLPVFHLLQAISLAHLQGSRFDDAYNVCKTVLQGKKKIFGKTSNEYHECLSIFATICEKKGDSLEAEAVRHSIPRHWSPRTPGNTLSAKQYILTHENLIESVFQKAVDEPTAGSPTLDNPAVDARASGHWKTLLPTNSRNGVHRAEHDERKGTIVEETDTGKEFLVETKPNPLPFLVSEPSSMTEDGSHQDNRRYGASSGLRPAGGIWSFGDHDQRNVTRPPGRRDPALESSYGLIPISPPSLPPRPRSPKTVRTVNSDAESVPDPPKPTIPSNPTAQDNLTAPETPLYARNLRSGNPSVHYTEKEALSSGNPTYLTAERNDSPSSHSHFIEGTTPKLGEGWYSTLEVVPTNPSLGPELSGSHPPDQSLQLGPSRADRIKRLSASPSSGPTSARLRTRWIVKKDISNIGEPRPSESRFTLPLYRPDNSSNNFSVAVSVRFMATDSIAFSLGQGDVAVCEIPPIKHQSILPAKTSTRSEMKKFLGRMRSSSGKKDSPSLDNSEYTVDIPNPRNWLEDFGLKDVMLSGEYFGGDAIQGFDLSSELRRLEAEIAKQIRQGVPEFVASSLKVEGISYSLPDFCSRTAWSAWTGILADSPLLQHARVQPHSLAILQYFIDTNANWLKHLDSYSPNPWAIVVLNCDDVVVEGSPYVVRKIDRFSRLEALESRTSFMMEFSGWKHAEREFAKLIDQQLTVAARQFKRRMDSSMVDEIIQGCCDHFRQRILPDFEDDGRDWVVDFDFPKGFPAGFQQGRFKFGNEEVLNCFQPSVRMVRKILKGTIHKLQLSGHNVSHVLLAGPYAKSRFLVRVLGNSIEEASVRNDSSIRMLHADDCADICTVGTLYHAMGA